MAAKIRLTRIGTKKQAHYRIVVTDSRAARNGRQLEVIGHYDPKKGLEKADFKQDRVRYWIECGAQPTGIVRQILKKSKQPAQPAA